MVQSTRTVSKKKKNNNRTLHFSVDNNIIVRIQQRVLWKSFGTALDRTRSRARGYIEKLEQLSRNPKEISTFSLHRIDLLICFIPKVFRSRNISDRTRESYARRCVRTMMGPCTAAFRASLIVFAPEPRNRYKSSLLLLLLFFTV